MGCSRKRTDQVVTHTLEKIEISAKVVTFHPSDKLRVSKWCMASRENAAAGGES